MAAEEAGSYLDGASEYLSVVKHYEAGLKSVTELTEQLALYRRRCNHMEAEYRMKNGHRYFSPTDFKDFAGALREKAHVVRELRATEEDERAALQLLMDEHSRLTESILTAESDTQDSLRAAGMVGYETEAAEMEATLGQVEAAKQQVDALTRELEAVRRRGEAIFEKVKSGGAPLMPKLKEAEANQRAAETTYSDTKARYEEQLARVHEQVEPTRKTFAAADEAALRAEMRCKAAQIDVAALKDSVQLLDDPQACQKIMKDIDEETTRCKERAAELEKAEAALASQLEKQRASLLGVLEGVLKAKQQSLKSRDSELVGDGVAVELTQEAQRLIVQT
eukprot:GHVU01102624.1.p1 GENE.GHVU01102624.1~~GHVU01102624.1.p1  ORF type:complete len:337 (+),score=106.59 GHVU01102624.1:793-1803(+)